MMQPQDPANGPVEDAGGDQPVTSSTGEQRSASRVRPTLHRATSGQRQDPVLLRRRIVPAQAEGPADMMQNGNGLAATEEEPSYVYALGLIEPRFPSLDVEKEFAQVTGRSGTEGLTDRAALHEVLRQPGNRYLARKLCYVFTIRGIEHYILEAEPSEIDMVVESIRPAPEEGDVDCLIGIRGPIAPPTACNGLMVPIVSVTQVYSFDVESFRKAIPKPEQASAEQFERSATELFNRIRVMAENAGATDEHRALNYVAMRYPAIYELTGQMFNENKSFSGVEVRPSRISGTRNIVLVIFTYTNRQTDVSEKYFCRVDVSGEFPFLVSKLAPFYGGADSTA